VGPAHRRSRAKEGMSENMGANRSSQGKITSKLGAEGDCRWLTPRGRGRETAKIEGEHQREKKKHTDEEEKRRKKKKCPIRKSQYQKTRRTKERLKLPTKKKEIRMFTWRYGKVAQVLRTLNASSTKTKKQEREPRNKAHTHIRRF